MAELIKLSKMAGVMHEADHALLLVRPVLLPITWIGQFFIRNLDCRILEF